MSGALGPNRPRFYRGLLLGHPGRQHSRRSPIAPDIRVPGDGDPVEWSARVRADVPEYVGEQLDEAVHRMRCTKTALIMRMIADYRVSGRQVFFVRPEDLVADRRTQRGSPVPDGTPMKPVQVSRHIWPRRSALDPPAE